MRTLVRLVPALLFVVAPLLARAQTTPAPAPAPAPAPQPAPQVAPPPPPTPEQVPVTPEAAAEAPPATTTPAAAAAATTTPTPAEDTVLYQPPPPGGDILATAPLTLAEPEATRRGFSSRQGRVSFFVDWTSTFPAGSSTDFASEPTWRGFHTGVRYFVKDYLAVGIESGWAMLDDKQRGTYTNASGTATLTATTLRFVDIVPIVATVHYYRLVADRLIVPFVGLSAGTYYIQRQLETALLVESRDAWHFGFGPEIGVGYNAEVVVIKLSGQFHYAFESGGLPEELFFELRFGVLGF